MAANTVPIFPKTPNVSWGTLTTANTAKDGTGTVVMLHTAGADGSRVDFIKIRPLGTNVATVLRLFLNNGSTNAAASNNSLYLEVTVAATTLSEVAALADYQIPLDVSLPAGYKINATIGTTIAAGLAVICVAGDY